MKSTFIAVLTLSSLPCAVIAQDISHNEHELNEVVISASPLEENSAGINQAVSVLTGDSLHRKAAATIGETLQDEPGVTNSGFGPGVGKPVIRGQVGNRVKVMQDGLGTLDASSASGDHAITTEALVAERIEVLRGPATLRYGNGAIGGVVNVIDNRIPDTLPDKTTGAVEYRHNSVNDQDSTVILLDGAITGTPMGNWAWHLDGLHRDSNNTRIDGYAQNPEPGEDPADHESTHGYIDNTDTRATTGTAGISWIGEKGFIGISLSEMENLYGIPPEAHGHEGDSHDEEPELIRIDMEQTRFDLKAEWADILPGFELGRFRISHNDYEHTELENGEKGTRFTNEAIEGRVELLHQEVAGWTGAVGVQLEDREFAAIGEEAFIPESDIRNGGIFWVGETTHGDWSYELGLRVDRQTIDPEDDSEISHNTQSLSLGGLWQMTDDQSVSLSLTHAQRAPAVEELLSFGPHHASESFDIGNADLNEETSHNIEFGYQYHGAVDLNINLFYNAIDDFIFKRNTGLIDVDEELSIFQYQQEDASFKGLEASIGVPLNDSWQLELFGDHVRAELDKSGDVPRIPPLRYGLALGYHADQWSTKLKLTEVQEQENPGDFEEKTEGYTRLDGHIHYHLDTANGTWLISLKANNLLDEEIRNSTSFLREIAPEPGRSLELGIRLSF
ncbi:MAG: TonB-dependent receptor [Porticoccus sp.]|nr:TonB-dependent receptor [Porticoccus sp.]MBQ0808127.1 TonB-dependent receptor [Porticoccus sp.]